jgi:hypothetical protein
MKRKEFSKSFFTNLGLSHQFIVSEFSAKCWPSSKTAFLELCVVYMHVISAFWKDETGGSKVQDQPPLLNMIPGQAAQQDLVSREKSFLDQYLSPEF